VQALALELQAADERQGASALVEGKRPEIVDRRIQSIRELVLVERGITCISCLYDCLQSGRNGNRHWHASLRTPGLRIVSERKCAQ